MVNPLGTKHCSALQASQAQTTPNQTKLVEALSQPAAYPGEDVGRVEVVETHISWIFLTETHAYKVKKPVCNEFVDYSTLERRHRLCCKEIELDRRFAPELYLDVVPIALDGSRLVIEGPGEVCEYAVKMHRFPADALLSHRLEQQAVKPLEIKELCGRIAEFHSAATQAAATTPYGEPATILREALENLVAIEADQFISASEQQQLAELRKWTQQDFESNELVFSSRKQTGWVRECHGDLHAGNVVWWQGRYTPFDGIEFNDSFRWIDVLNDLAFLAMDVSVRGHRQLSNLLISCYLESTGDYLSLALVRWYMIYRALVRAKVASMVMSQHDQQSSEFVAAHNARANLLEYAVSQTQLNQPRLWITHGLSGSGKSTGAESIVQRQSAIRLRADVERKRLAGLRPNERPPAEQSQQLYSADMSRHTYDRLCQLASGILQAGFSVVVDATFLKSAQRQQFARLAEKQGIPFQILDFQADVATLKKRIMDRQARGTDASDADLDVLSRQCTWQEPLSEIERQRAVVMPCE